MAWVGCGATTVTRPANGSPPWTKIGDGPIGTQRSLESASRGRGADGGTSVRIARSRTSGDRKQLVGYVRCRRNQDSPSSACPRGVCGNRRGRGTSPESSTSAAIAGGASTDARGGGAG